MSNPKVRCMVDTCIHRVNGDLCKAAEIRVQGETARNEEGTSCRAFRHRGDPANMISYLENANITGILKQALLGRQSLNPATACAAENCRHWERGNRCNAESIEITGQDAQRYEATFCATFEEQA